MVDGVRQESYRVMLMFEKENQRDKYTSSITCRVEVRPSLSVCVSKAVLNDLPDMTLMISLYSR